MPVAMPAIDQNKITSWSEQEQALYNSYPFWLMAYQLRLRETWATHSRLTGKKTWKPNMGGTMRGVRKEPSPHIRQEALPQELSKPGKKDIIDVHEVTVEATLKHQYFESRAFHFYPSFVDFMKDHVKATTTDVAAKVQRFDDIFVRTAVFHCSPLLFIANKANGEVIDVPWWDAKDVAGVVKTAAVRATWIPQVGQPGNLSITNCFLVDSFLREDIRATPNQGDMGMPSDDSPVTGKNVLCLSSEAYNQFRFDPFLLDNRTINLDIVQKGFKGAIGDNIICRIEDLPLRMKADGTFPNPQARVLGADAYNTKESVITDDYKNAPYEFAFMYADKPYDSLQIGPPPGDFTSGFEPDNFKDLLWNAEVKLTKDFAIPTVDENGTATFDWNNYGEYLKAICHGQYGILPTQRRWAIPILFKRVRGVSY